MDVNRIFFSLKIGEIITIPILFVFCILGLTIVFFTRNLFYPKANNIENDLNINENKENICQIQIAQTNKNIK